MDAGHCTGIQTSGRVNDAMASTHGSLLHWTHTLTVRVIKHVNVPPPLN